jgi:hypothetical protein
LPNEHRGGVIRPWVGGQLYVSQKPARELCASGPRVIIVRVLNPSLYPIPLSSQARRTPQ